MNYVQTAESHSPWRLPTPVIVLCGVLTIAGALYTFKFGWHRNIYVLTGLAFSIGLVACVARAASWPKAGTDELPLPTLLFIIAGVGAFWPLILITGTLTVQLYFLHRFLKYLAAGSGLVAGGLVILLVSLLGVPLLLLGLFIIARLLAAVVGPPVYW